jgi:PKD repeat protein
MEVDLIADPTEGEAPLEVDFLMSVDEYHHIDIFAWDFGDDTYKENDSSMITHTFEEPGSYHVMCLAIDKQAFGNDISEMESVTIEVTNPDTSGDDKNDGNDELQVTISADPTSGCPAGEVFTVNFTSTVTGGVSPYTYAWDFGDESPTDQPPATEANPEHNYNMIIGEITYTVELTVTDSDNTQATSNQIEIEICSGS